MALFNYATKEITLKIVYYGPGLSGKTTNLQFLHSVLNPDTKGKLLSLSTESDRTLFFDFLPIELGKIRDFSIRFQLYTVPGQVRYNATRKVVLKGADAIVFVADSQKAMRDQNAESFANMRENLFANNINPDEIPVILQYNKRDLKNVLSVDELNQDLNPYDYPVLEATAVNGQGVEETFKLVTKLLLKYISKKHKIEIQPVPQKESPEKEVSAPEVSAPVMEAPIPEAIPAGVEEAEEPVLARPADRFELVPEYTGEIELDTESEPEEALPLPELETALPELETALPEPEPLSPPSVAEKEEMPSAPERIWPQPAEPAATMPPAAEAVTPPPSPATQDRNFDGLRDAVSGLADRIDAVTDEITLLQGALKELQSSVQKISGDKKPSQEKELRELRGGQQELLDLVRNLAATIDGLREKKTWFKL